MKKFKLLLLTLTLSIPCFCQSISISNSGAGGGTWSVSSLSANVTSAGNNYAHFEESSASHTQLKLGTLLFYSVSVSQSLVSNWDPALKLYVKRTGNGTGGGTISNGTEYMLLTTSPQGLFSGFLGVLVGRDNIPIQFKIDGLSVMLPVKAYTTTVQFTVVGL